MVHRQWIVALRDLPDAGRSWDASVSREMLGDAAEGSVEPLPGLCDDVRWRLSIVRKGDVYRLTGDWQVTARRECCRCNAMFDWHVEGASERDFRLADRVGELDEDGSDCEIVEAPGNIDLLDILREDVWLAWKPEVACSEDCKGLCVQCGHDLNDGPCACEKDDPTHPFAILRQLKKGA